MQDITCVMDHQITAVDNSTLPNNLMMIIIAVYWACIHGSGTQQNASNALILTSLWWRTNAISILQIKTSRLQSFKSGGKEFALFH